MFYRHRLAVFVAATGALRARKHERLHSASERVAARIFVQKLFRKPRIAHLPLNAARDVASR